MWPAYGAEFVGTALLVLLGNGVVANVVLEKTKGSNGGWIVITAGWALAVFTAVLCVGAVSGAHLNPAITVALAAADRFPWTEAPGYILAQLTGALAGAALVLITHYDHYKATPDPAAKLATFATSPAIRNPGLNVMTEIIATAVLAGAVLYMPESVFSLDGTAGGKVGLGALGAIPVALIVFAIGLGAGGPTGYAINPARDLGPRLAHYLLPVPDKGTSDWGYAWVPVAGPLLGGLLAAVFAVLF